mgnify:CR=1 FL=1
MFYNVKPTREREIYQVFVNNKLTAVTKERMAAIKIRNLAQNNGALADIRTTDRRHATKDCLEMLELLEDGE